VAERVERTDDPRISDYQHVGDPAWLLARGLFVAEGRLVVERLLEGGRFPVRSILLTPAALRSIEPLGGDVPVFVAEQRLLNGITGFNFHRGCLALAQRPSLDSAHETRPSLVSARLLLAVEGVGNPDNVGGLFRVAAAFGVENTLSFRIRTTTSRIRLLNSDSTPWPRLVGSELPFRDAARASRNSPHAGRA
jgi:tRNA G18 (ribose-2'-O)-methylase SpoU